MKLSSVKVYSIKSVGITMKCTSGRENDGSKADGVTEEIKSCSTVGRNRQVPRTVSTNGMAPPKEAFGKGKGDRQRELGPDSPISSVWEYKGMRGEVPERRLPLNLKPDRTARMDKLTYQATPFNVFGLYFPRSEVISTLRRRARARNHNRKSWHARRMRGDG